MTISYSEDHTYPPSERSENDVNSLSLMQAVDYCLNVLKIKDNSEIYRNITKFIQIKVTLTFVKTHGNDNSKLQQKSKGNNSHIFAQSPLYDLFVVLPKPIKKDKL